MPHFPKSGEELCNWAGKGLEGVQKQEGQLPNQGTCGGHARLAAPAGGNAEHGSGGRGVCGGRLRAPKVVGEGDDRRKC